MRVADPDSANQNSKNRTWIRLRILPVIKAVQIFHITQISSNICYVDFFLKKLKNIRKNLKK